MLTGSITPYQKVFGVLFEKYPAQFHHHNMVKFIRYHAGRMSLSKTRIKDIILSFRDKGLMSMSQGWATPRTFPGRHRCWFIKYDSCAVVKLTETFTVSLLVTIHCGHCCMLTCSIISSTLRDRWAATSCVNNGSLLLAGLFNWHGTHISAVAWSSAEYSANIIYLLPSWPWFRLPDVHHARLAQLPSQCSIEWPVSSFVYQTIPLS